MSTDDPADEYPRSSEPVTAGSEKAVPSPITWRQQVCKNYWNGVYYTMLAGFIFAVGSVTLWVWNADVEESCASRYGPDFHCRVGTAQEKLYWDGVYEMLWKIGISFAVMIFAMSVIGAAKFSD